jgi:hypothetical protein
MQPPVSISKGEGQFDDRKINTTIPGGRLSAYLLTKLFCASPKPQAPTTWLHIFPIQSAGFNASGLCGFNFHEFTFENAKYTYPCQNLKTMTPSVWNPPDGLATEILISPSTDAADPDQESCFILASGVGLSPDCTMRARRAIYSVIVINRPPVPAEFPRLNVRPGQPVPSTSIPRPGGHHWYFLAKKNQPTAHRL